MVFRVQIFKKLKNATSKYAELVCLLSLKLEN